MSVFASHVAAAAEGPYNPYDHKVSCGTTLIAVEFADGVVIGADSRTSSGSFIVNRVTDKLTEVSKTVYACRSGSAADTQAITDIVKYYSNIYELTHNKPTPVEVTAQMFRGICYDYRDDLSAGLLIAGWDKEKGGQVFSIPIGGMVTRRAVASGGSGSTYVYGYMDSQYKPNMPKEQAVKYVLDAVTLAISRDGSSGGVCRIGIITKDGIERRLTPFPKLPKFFEG